MLAIRTILHPTDFSASAEYARRMALSLSRDYGARLVVLHVAQSEIVHGGLIGGPDERKSHLEALESQLRDIFGEDFDTQAEFHVKEGEPAAAILHMTEEVHADLIVMGTTGRSGLGRLLLGSVVEEVMRKARCPILTVRSPSEILATQVPLLTAAGA